MCTLKPPEGGGWVGSRVLHVLRLFLLVFNTPTRAGLPKRLGHVEDGAPARDDANALGKVEPQRAPEREGERERDGSQDGHTTHLSLLELR